MSLILVPISIKDANVLIDRLHRHHEPSNKHRFAVAVAVEWAEEPCGAAIVGDTTARMADDGWTCEVRRVATDGTKNACSMLYAACWRAARALGWRRCITYTLLSEGGASLRAAGWRVVGQTEGGSWDRKDRPRVDHAPTEPKLKWEAPA